MNYAWMKLYVEILDDPKMGKMTDSLFRNTILIFLIACKNGGSGELPDIESLAWLLRKDTKTITEIIEALITNHIIEKVGARFIVKNYGKRQSPPNFNERQGRARNGMSRNRDKIVNATEQETEQDSEQDTELKKDTEKELELETDTHTDTERCVFNKLMSHY